jgi:hypothetical protein
MVQPAIKNLNSENFNDWDLMRGNGILAAPGKTYPGICCCPYSRTAQNPVMMPAIPISIILAAGKSKKMDPMIKKSSNPLAISSGHFS